MKPREIIHIRFTPPGVINDRTLTRLGWAASRVALIRLIGSTSKDYYRDGMIRIETRRIIRFFSHQFRSSLPIRCLSSSVIRFQISYLEIGKIPLSKWRNFTDRNSQEFSRDIDRKFPKSTQFHKKKIGIIVQRDVAYICFHRFSFDFFPYWHPWWQMMHSRPVCLQSLTRTANK